MDAIEKFPVNSPSGDAYSYQRLLAVASLFKGSFSLDWLVDLFIGKKPSLILSELEQGVRDGCLVRGQPGCYAFADERKQHKWMSFLSQDDQKQLHGLISDILMRELPDDAEKARAVAHHLLNISNDPDRCRYLARAGDLNQEALNTEEALQCYRKVLDDLSTLEGDEEDRLFSEIAIKYSKISTGRHDTAKVLSILRAALKRAEKRELQGTIPLIKMHMAKNEWLRSRYCSALKHFEEGWRLANDLNDPKSLRAATIFSTFFHFWQGRFRDAVDSYERSVPEIEKYPRGGFPLLATITAGYCYAQIGHVTQGLGMLDSIRSQCLEKGNVYLAAYAVGNMGNILLDMGRIDDAIQYLENSGKLAQQVHNDWVWITGKSALAYAYYLKDEKQQTLRYLREFFEDSRKVQATVNLYPYVLELGLAMRRGDLPTADELSIEKVIGEMVGGENIFLKGVAHRFRAELLRMQSGPARKVSDAIEESVKWLEKSGSQAELAKSRLLMARHHLALGQEEKAKELILVARNTLASLNEALVPDDLRALVKDRPAGETLLKEILKLGQEVVTIRDNKDLVHHIISTVNRIAGAERGAIFLWQENSGAPGLVLRASKNLTVDQIEHPNFASSMKMIEDVARAGKGRILGMSSKRATGSEEVIRSRICVPMILHDKTVGVLYHDNRLLSSAFKESDLELLSYFAALAAFALDNARAYDEVNRLNIKLSEENLYYKEQHLQNLHFEDIVGESPAIKRVLAQVNQVTGTDATVMIIGETGVGKELVARATHRHSPRCDKPFIRVHCSALPETLIPSELFGHEKGAFTGATRQRIGRFELADGGTLFLDEIGDLSLEIQVRLLRVLQTREFERVGGSETLKSDFRLIVATNRDLEKEVKAGRFRTDLYYRLAVFPIYVPSLRERRDDIPLLAYYFLGIYAKKMGKNITKIPNSEMEKLLTYHWPGNVRELENVIERGTILSYGPFFHVPELGAELPEASPEIQAVTLMENERKHILWALERTGWKVRGQGGAAELLGLPASTLAFRMKKAGIERPKKLAARSAI